MKAEKLGFLTHIKTGKLDVNAGQEDGKYPFFTCANTSYKINEYAFDNEAVLVAGNGDLNVKYFIGKFNAYQRTYVIEKREDAEISMSYLYYFMETYMDHLRKKSIGGIIKYIKLGHLTEAKIPLPPLDDQKRIAHLLSKVGGLIAKRKQHLQQLDALLKSIFLEMFGPTNPSFEKWSLVEIRELAAKHKGAMRTGPFGSNLLHGEFSTDGDVAVLGIDNAVQNCFAWGERRFITNDKYQELENYRIFPGDVIITIMGTIGRSAVIPDDIPVAINTKHLAAITLNRKIANPLFLSYSIHSSPFLLNQFKGKNRGAIMSG